MTEHKQARGDTVDFLWGDETQYTQYFFTATSGPVSRGGEAAKSISEVEKKNQYILPFIATSSLPPVLPAWLQLDPEGSTYSHRLTKPPQVAHVYFFIFFFLSR